MFDMFLACSQWHISLLTTLLTMHPPPQTEAALLYDATQLFAEAVVNLSGSRDIGDVSLSCDREDHDDHWEDRQSIIRAMRNVSAASERLRKLGQRGRQDVWKM